MESDKSVKLSKEERGEIFEIVNSQYLNFKGAKKKSFKQNFKSVWKEDNNLFKLVMTLYNALKRNNIMAYNSDENTGKNTFMNAPYGDCKWRRR